MCVNPQVSQAHDLMNLSNILIINLYIYVVHMIWVGHDHLKCTVLCKYTFANVAVENSSALKGNLLNGV